MSAIFTPQKVCKTYSYQFLLARGPRIVKGKTVEHKMR